MLRKFWDSGTGGNGETMDDELELLDDGTFVWTCHVHSFDFGYSNAVRGRWREEGDAIHLTADTGQDTSWPAGSERIARYRDRTLHIDGYELRQLES